MNTGKFILKLNPTLKQKACWEKLLDNTTEFILFGGGAGGGKVVAKGDSILTPFGFKKIETLKEGTLVNNPDGSISKIIKLHPWMKYDKWTINFIDGTNITTTGGHLWNAWKCGKGRKIKNQVVHGEKSGEIIETRGMLEWIERGYNVAIPVCKEQHFNVTNRKKVTLEPYILGLFLGDGCITSNTISITSADIDHISRIFKPESYTKRGINFDFKGVYRKHLIDCFTKLELFNKKSLTKFIPRQYKYTSIEERYELIQGLMDTDGYASKDGKLYYTTISPELAKGVAFVLRSLGSIVTITKKKAGYKKEGIYIPCNDAYELYIKHRNPERLFKLKRKKDKCKEYKTICKRIKNIEITKDLFEGRCISVSHPNGLYITNDFTVTHNSWVGCEWLVVLCLSYPGVKLFVGRNELKRIMQSTYITFQKVCKWHKIPRDSWKFNAQYSYVEFWNGSRIDFIDLKYMPQDPLYERYGSVEYTSGWIEEAGEVKFRAFDVLKSRIGRHLNDELGIHHKMLLTCNPKKNWLYFDVYKPWKANTMDSDWVFIQSLYTDNPYTASTYGRMLSKIKDPILRERLRNGNWEYDNDDASLMNYENVLNMFSNQYTFDASEEMYLTVDVARFGRDKAVFIVWQGHYIKKIWFYPKSSLDFLEESIISACEKYRIPRSNVVVDEDGMGGGVVDHVKGVVGFVNGSRAIEEFDEDSQETDRYSYKNLRSQCYFKLAELINDNNIGCYEDVTPDIRNWIIEELEGIRRKDATDNEKKLQVISKDDIKDVIGRSPDFADALMMRCYFDLGMLSNPEVSVEW